MGIPFLLSSNTEDQNGLPTFHPTQLTKLPAIDLDVIL